MPQRKKEFNTNRLKRRMKEKNYTQRGLAEKIGRELRTIQTWFYDDKSPNEESLTLLCEALDVSSDFFFTRAQDNAWGNYDYQIAKDTLGEDLIERIPIKSEMRKDAETLNAIPLHLDSDTSSEAQNLVEGSIQKGQDLMEEGDEPVEGLGE